MTPDQQRLVDSKLYTRQQGPGHCGDPSECGHLDCPTAFCDAATVPGPRCRLCGKTALEIKGYLNRTNEFGVKGVWECVPSCHPGLREAALLCLQTNGGPIDGADTTDGESYVMVRMDAFNMLEAAIKPERDSASA
jgi:hypothetical protein